MEHNKTSNPAGQWLDAAVAKIRFGPDRKEVRAELSAHLEDKALDFQRIFPDLTEDEARERAAAEMGDPMEIGKELARIHKPWLGYLWRASQVLAGGALIWLVVVAVPLAWSWLNPRETETEESLWTYEAEIPFSSQGPVQAGGYTLQVEGVLQMEEGHDVGELALTWTAFSPLVWEEPTSHLYWRAEDNLGNVYFSHADLDMAIYVAETYRYVPATTWERSGLGWTGRCRVWNVPREAQWVRLILDFDEEPITILLEREEGAP